MLKLVIKSLHILGIVVKKIPLYMNSLNVSGYYVFFTENRKNCVYTEQVHLPACDLNRLSSCHQIQYRVFFTKKCGVIENFMKIGSMTFVIYIGE